MMKPKRLKVTKAQLEGQMFKMERRIQKMAEAAYKVRQALEQINLLEVQASALHTKREEARLSASEHSQDSRGTQLSSN